MGWNPKFNRAEVRSQVYHGVDLRVSFTSSAAVGAATREAVSFLPDVICVYNMKDPSPSTTIFVLFIISSVATFIVL